VFSFSAHPAMISVTQGIQDAFRYLGASWRRWLPMVLLISVFTLVIYAVVYSYVGSTDFRSLYYVDSYTGQIVFEPDAQSKLWSLVLPGLAIGLVYVILNMVAGWVFAATAISGLRNRPLTIAGVRRTRAMDNSRRDSDRGGGPCRGHRLGHSHGDSLPNRRPACLCGHPARDLHRDPSHLHQPCDFRRLRPH